MARREFDFVQGATPFLLLFGSAVVLSSCESDTGPDSSSAAGAPAGQSGSGAGASSGKGGSGAGRGGTAGAGGFGVAGVSGTSGGAAGSAGSDGGGRSGAGGVAGAGGIAAGGVAGAGGSSGSVTSGGEGGAPTTGAGCAARSLLICEDFESTAVGDVPDGWTRHGNPANVADDDAHGGAHALKLGPVDSGERRIYHDAALLGSAHWGRIFYKVRTPVPDAFVHSTLVSLMGEGPMNGRSEYRPIDTVKQAIDTPDVGSRHNFIYNVQILGGDEFGRETSYDYVFDAEWHCAEYHIDASNQSYTLYFDGADILHFENGAGNYNRSDIPDVFDELRVGWNNYQSAPPGFTVWIDDIAFDDARIGCD